MILIAYQGATYIRGFTVTSSFRKCHISKLGFLSDIEYQWLIYVVMKFNIVSLLYVVKVGIEISLLNKSWSKMLFW